jgi:hypothetical protein
MKTIRLLRKDFTKVYVQLALVGALLLAPVHALMAQAASSADAEGISGWVIGIALLALLVLSWASRQIVVKRRAAREARLVQQQMVEEVKRLAAERRAQKETWANGLPDRLEAAMEVGGTRTPEEIAELVFEGHPDSAHIPSEIEGLVKEAISELDPVLWTGKGRDYVTAVSFLEAIKEGLKRQRRQEEAQRMTQVRSGAPSQTATAYSPVKVTAAIDVPPKQRTEGHRRTSTSMMERVWRWLRTRV